MFSLNVRFQIAALLIMAIIFFDFVKSKRLPLLSTKYFFGVMVSATIYLCTDIVTVYTVNHLDTVSPWLNRFAHQVFIGGLGTVLVLLYMYVITFSTGQRRFRGWRLWVRFLPYAVSLLFVFFSKLHYCQTPKGAYSYGPMVHLLYFTSAVYVIAIVAETIKYRTRLSKEKVISFLGGCAVWSVAGLVQFFNPHLLLSGIGIALLILLFYLSFENPREHREEQTGCFNKRALNLMLAEKIAAGKGMVIINIVFENLYQIYSQVGHNNGDRMIALLGRYLGTFFSDRVYYSRGNVLTVLLNAMPDEFSQMLSTLQDRLYNTWNIDGNRILVKAHVDLIEVQGGGMAADNIKDIINYMAELRDEDCNGEFFRRYDEALEAKRFRYTTLEKLIQDAIENDGFQVYYQPIYSTTQRGFSALEALARLKDSATLGYVSPEEFIRVAEKKGMIQPIGEQIFEKVCSFCAKNDLKALGISRVEVNVSGLQMIDRQLPKTLEQIMGRYGIDPAFINLEITETIAVSSGEIINENIRALKQMGCSFSMDDFGTGYANLSKIANLAYDMIKIDKSLLWPCFEVSGEKACTVLENVVDMILNLKFIIVAEGVETAEQAKYLADMGIEYLQGFYFSRPLDEAALLRFLTGAHEAQAVTC